MPWSSWAIRQSPAPGRSVYLCAAQELRQGTNTDPASRAAGANIASKMTPTMIFEYMGIRLDTMAVPDLNFVAVANLPEGYYTVTVHNGVILYQTGITCDNPDVVWNTNTTGLLAIATNKTAGIEKLVQQEGDTSLTTRLAEAMVELSQYKFFHIVEP